MKRTITVLTAVAALALTGCGTGVPTPKATPAPVTTPYSFVDTNIPNSPTIEDSVDDSSDSFGAEYSPGAMPGSLQETVLDSLWDDMGYASRDQICTGWRFDSRMMLDKFMEAASESYDRAVVRAFFDGKC